MIRHLRLCCLPLLLLFATGCGKNNPRDVAETWLEGFNHMDFERSMKLSTDDTKNLLASLQELTSGVSDSAKEEIKKITVSIKDVKEDGDKAVVTYVSSDNQREQALNLVRKGDRWLVLFTKSDLMGNVESAEETIDQQQPATADTPAATITVGTPAQD